MKSLLMLAVCVLLLCGCVEIADDSFAKCLTKDGVKMYGAYWCPDCQDQKGVFGGSWQYVDYVECATVAGGQTQACRDANITGYPTWVFRNGSRETGELSVPELRAMTGCGLNQS